MKFKDFELMCDTLIEKNTLSQRTSILDFLQNVKLLKVIKNIINNEDILIEISKKSYIHNNGFAKIFLIDKRPHYALRLHIWPSLENLNPSIHDHPWDITVKIISGEYTWVNYSVEDIDDKNASLYKCNYRDNYNSHEIVFSKKITVLEKESINYKQGDIFNYSKNIYHSIYKLNANYVDSLILCGITVEPTANIISFDDISSLSGSNKYLSSDHLKT